MMLGRPAGPGRGGAGRVCRAAGWVGAGSGCRAGRGRGGGVPRGAEGRRPPPRGRPAAVSRQPGRRRRRGALEAAGQPRGDGRRAGGSSAPRRSCRPRPAIPGPMAGLAAPRAPPRPWAALLLLAVLLPAAAPGRQPPRAPPEVPRSAPVWVSVCWPTRAAAGPCTRRARLASVGWERGGELCRGARGCFETLR